MDRVVFAERPEQLLDQAALSTMSGLAFLRGIRDGLYPQPPIGRTLGFRLMHADAGRVEFRCEPGFDSYNPMGAVHGGWFGAVLDSCMSCAVQSLLPKGKGYTTLEYKISMVRPVDEKSGPLKAIGTATHVGRRTGLASGRLQDADGKLYASGTATCLVMEIGGPG